MFRMEEKWLISVVQSSSIGSATEALMQGANPNILSPEQGINATHAAIRTGNLQMVKLLIEKSQRHLVDLNTVTHEFKPGIVVASTECSQNKKEIIREIIVNRVVSNRDLLKQYIFICVNNITRKETLTEADFSMLAHYSSRLCGENIGTLINSDNNDDRYLIHLCQYSGAKVYNQDKVEDVELEGWTAYEFLPIRMFSLFEILVKLEAGLIVVGEKAKWAGILRKEILTELETFKVEQERKIISDDPDFNDDDRKGFYSILAERLIKNIVNAPNHEFCMASGYRGHAIYIAFFFDKDSDELKIRYDNLGVGINSRHPENNGMIYPREIKIENATLKIKVITEYLTRLFLVKSQKLPDRYPKNASKQEREIAEMQYREAREKILSEIYDDKNMLGSVLVATFQQGMQEQMADTCVTTSHQVGLLFRLKDESFYKWVVAEEKRCVVQAKRNEGSLKLKVSVLWNDVVNFKAPEYSDCCSIDEMMKFISNKDIIARVYQIEKLANNDNFYECLKKTLDENNYEKTKLFHKSIQQEMSQGRAVSTLLYALLLLRLGIDENVTLDRFQHLDKSKEFFEITLKSGCYRNTNAELYFNYFLGLIFYNLNQIDRAESAFLTCSNLSLSAYRERIIFKERNHASSFSFYTSAYSSEEDLIELKILKILKVNSDIALGFLNIEKCKYEEAAIRFESTSEKSSVKDGVTHSGTIFSVYSSEAFFGLGLIEYFKATNMSQGTNLYKTHINVAIQYFKKINDKSSKIFYKAQNRLAEINESLTKIDQSSIALPSNSQPITPLRDAVQARSQSPTQERENKRPRINTTISQN